MVSVYLPEDWIDGDIYPAGSLNTQNNETNNTERIIASFRGGSIVNNNAATVMGSLVWAAGEVDATDSLRAEFMLGHDGGATTDMTIRMRWSGAATGFGGNNSDTITVDPVGATQPYKVVHYHTGSGNHGNLDGHTYWIAPSGNTDVTGMPFATFPGTLVNGRLHSGGALIFSFESGSPGIQHLLYGTLYRVPHSQF